MLQVITKSDIETLGPVLLLKVQGVVTNILPVERSICDWNKQILIGENAFDHPLLKLFKCPPRRWG